MTDSRMANRISILGDFVLLWIFFVLGFMVYAGDKAWKPVYIAFYLYLTLCWLVLSAIFGAFRQDAYLEKGKILGAYTKIIVFFFFLFLLFFQVRSLSYYPREDIKILFPAFFAGLMLWKFGFYYGYAYYRKKGAGKKQVMILGNAKAAQRLAQYLSANWQHGYQLAGSVDLRELSPAQAAGQSESLPDLLRRHAVDEIFLSIDDLKHIDKERLEDLLHDYPAKVNLVLNLENFTFQGIELHEYGNIPVLKIHPGPLSYWYNRLLKRSFDLVFSSLVILLVLSWLSPLLWLIDLLTGRHGLFFTQQRSSILDKTFTIIKYRTMVANAEADLKQATQGDERITPLGRFLRKTSLDELPQFFNVWLGHMSVVGPRPHMLRHTESYRRIVRSFMLRHTVKPGITGLAQVNGFRGEIKTPDDIQRRVELDIEYIRHWKFELDLRIIGRTCWLVFRG